MPSPVHLLRTLLLSLCALLSGAAHAAAAAAGPPPALARIPLSRGLALVSTLQSPQGDRENIVTVQDASADGVQYDWQLEERGPGGQINRSRFGRFVRAQDLASARRLHAVFSSRDAADYPGYTAYSFSSAIYDELAAGAPVAFGVTERDDAAGKGLSPLGGGLLASAVTFKGTLTASARTPEPFPMLVNGVRSVLPALHVAGEFTFREQRIHHEFWLLADRTHPLLLKVITNRDVWQLIRVDGVVQAQRNDVEQTLQQKCRAELPGVYFAFGTADLDTASDRTLAEVAAILSRHADWTLSVEGHTDNIGTATANQKLSEARATAVRSHLIARGRISAARLQASGLGMSVPRESNATAAGRARNRRVELARPCPTTDTRSKQP
jgi:outer membrane protein OmpA-like peptidoglycan-associated protein